VVVGSKKDIQAEVFLVYAIDVAVLMMFWRNRYVAAPRTSALSLPPQDMRHRHARPRAILALQIHHHARRQQERRAGKHLHPEREEERPDHVVGVERAAGETARDVRDDEQDPAVAGVVGPAEEARVAEGGDLDVLISMRDGRVGVGACGVCLRLLR
jgi:hypothetical protein